MTYTMCIHNLINYYSQERVLVKRWISNNPIISNTSIICLQLNCLFSKRVLGNRYGPY